MSSRTPALAVSASLAVVALLAFASPQAAHSVSKQAKIEPDLPHR